METFRKFEITLISASNLPNVRSVFDMKVFAKVSIGGVAETESTTPVDREGNTNPCWNHKMTYAISEEIIHKDIVNVSIQLYCQRTLKPNKYVGEVNLSLKGLFDHAQSAQNLTYKVKRNDDDSKGDFGTIEISYAFGEKCMVEEDSAGNALKVAGAILKVVKVAVEIVSIFAT